jgi:adenylate cyclase
MARNWIPPFAAYTRHRRPYAQRALRLSPFDPLAYHSHMAMTFAAMLEERYDEAAAHGAKLAQVSPNFASHLMIYAVALALAAR